MSGNHQESSSVGDHASATNGNPSDASGPLHVQTTTNLGDTTNTTITATTSPMMSDLLWAIQHSQSEQEQRNTNTNWTTTTVDNNDDNESEYHSITSGNDQDQQGSDMATVPLHSTAAATAPRSGGLYFSSLLGGARNRQHILEEEQEESLLLESNEDDNDSTTHSTNNPRQRSVSEPEMRAFLQSAATLRQRRRPSNNNNNRSRSYTTEDSRARTETTSTSRGETSEFHRSHPAPQQQNHHADVFLSPLTSSEPPLTEHTMEPAFSSSLPPTTLGYEWPHANPERHGIRNNNNNDTGPTTTTTSSSDRETMARIRWVRINRRFQMVITCVALVFSLLLFAILIGWVVLTSAYVVSLDQPCDIPLKIYFWLVTLQLVLDVFRSDIMRFCFQWDSRSSQRIPRPVIAYNVAYLIYALMVLRLGITSLFRSSSTTTCRSTAPDLFNASMAFVSLSIAAWSTIICGYLLPFCVVAVLLTWNGYSPSNHHSHSNSAPMATQAVFPAAYSTSGAPPGCIEQLPILSPEDFPLSYPSECCICMEDFVRQDVVVETKCRHVFHKSCCREWLRQARTCPVCRADIPSTLEQNSSFDDSSQHSSSRPASAASIPIGPSGRPVVGLWRTLRRAASSYGGDTPRGSDDLSPRPMRDDPARGVEQAASIEMEAGLPSGIRDV